MANNFFKNGDKAYSENLNDGVLVGNAFDWTVSIGLPADAGLLCRSFNALIFGETGDFIRY